MTRVEETIIYWIAFFLLYGIAIKLFILIKKWNDDKKNTRRKLSPAEIKTIKFTKIPTGESIAIALLMFVLGIGSIIGGAFLGKWIFEHVNGIYATNNMNIIYFFHNDFSFFLYIIYFMFLFVSLFMGYLWMKIAIWFPNFGLYTKRIYLDNFKENRETNFAKDARICLFIGIFLTLIMAPFLVFGAFHYSYVTNEGIFYNPFFSTQEKMISWDEIEKVLVSNNKQDINSKWLIYEAIGKDQKEYIVYKDYCNVPCEADTIRILLEQKGIPLLLKR